MTLFRNLCKDNRGQDLIEYALMAGFVAIAAAAVMPNLKSQLQTLFNTVGSHLQNSAK